MQITVDETVITLSPDFDEYVDLMCAAVVKPGEPPVPNRPQMIHKILHDNFAANIQQHAAVRPKAVAAKFKAIEEAAGKQIGDVIASSLGG